MLILRKKIRRIDDQLQFFVYKYTVMLLKIFFTYLGTYFPSSRINNSFFKVGTETQIGAWC